MNTKAKSEQRTVIRENEDQAKAFILEMEVNYIQAVIEVFDSLKELGIKSPSKSLLFDTIAGKIEPLQTAYDEITRSDIEGFKSQAAKDQMASIFADKLSGIRQQVKEMFSGDFGNQYAGGWNFPSFNDLIRNREKWGFFPMSDPKLYEFVEIIEDVPVIPEEAKVRIMDIFRDYALPGEQIIVEKQVKAAAALKELTGALTEAGIHFDLEIFPQSFMKRFFDILKDDDGNIEIAARIDGIR
jgi:hypothetical protein